LTDILSVFKTFSDNIDVEL